MNLHENKEVFEQYLAATADYLGIANTGVVEKDYYVSLFLQRIANKQPDVIFKGGTSLSKCHRIIRRFSEDIDLSVDTEASKLTEGQRKKLMHDIVSIVDEAGFIIENLDLIHSSKDLNRYVINYMPEDYIGYLSRYLVVETSVFIKSFPSELMSAASLVYDFLLLNNALDEIEKYGLQPFKVKVQAIARTFIDKVFAITDYYISGNLETHSRHIYDLYKIYPTITFDRAFAIMVDEVRKVRKPHKVCNSAHDGVDLPELLRKIVREDTFKSDYNQITRSLLFEDVPYADAIVTLDSIINDGFFTQ